MVAHEVVLHACSNVFFHRLAVVCLELVRVLRKPTQKLPAYEQYELQVFENIYIMLFRFQEALFIFYNSTNQSFIRI